MIDRLFAFLQAGASPFHAAAHAAAALDAAGYLRLEETALWSPQPGQGYYVMRGQSSVVAWRMPRGEVRAWRLAASHSDSPGWRVKNWGAAAQGTVRLNVEGYGGVLMASWFDRPLTVAGRAMVRAGRRLEGRLVCPDRDLLVIPSLAIHMDRAANDGHRYDPQAELQPLLGCEGCPELGSLLAAELGVARQDIVDADLRLAVRQAPVRVGAQGEWYLAPRIDDLAGAAATLEGFLSAAPQAPDGVGPVWLLLDAEEVGSDTRQGAGSTFVRDTLARALEAAGQNAPQAMQRALAGGCCLCADNAHAVHPAHPEASDPQNPVRLGGGPVLKYTAGTSYTTTAATGALVRELCRQNGIPLQVFANRTGARGGGTLGHLLARTLPVPMADIGLPQLAMHSAVETAAVADAGAMAALCAAYYRAALRAEADGVYTL